MKRTLALLAVLAVLLVLPGADALAAGSADTEKTVLLDSDGVFLSPSRYLGQMGREMPDQEAHFALRLLAFARAYDCDVYAGCMESPSRMDPAAAAFEEYRDRFLADHPEALGENAVCLLYDAESNSAFVRVGAAVAEDCDTASVEEALRDQEESDSYFRMVRALDALQRAAGRRSLLVTASDDAAYVRTEQALEPLRKVFSGPVFVMYLSTEEDADNALPFFDAYNTYGWMPSFYPDSILIYYYRNTGEALVQLGEEVDLRLTDLTAVEAAFGPSRGPRDFSGFGSGVQALADHAIRGRETPAWVGPALLGTAFAVLVLALLIEAAARRQGDPLLPQGAERRG